MCPTCKAPVIKADISHSKECHRKGLKSKRVCPCKKPWKTVHDMNRHLTGVEGCNGWTTFVVFCGDVPEAYTKFK